MHSPGRFPRVIHSIARLGLFVVAFHALVANAAGQLKLPESGMVRSVSGQFNVRKLTGVTDRFREINTNQDLVHLEPTLVTVSSERIKQLVNRELASSAPWRGKIFIGLVPATGDTAPITIVSDRFRGSWQYRVELPDVIERARYVRTIVQVLLLELANRSSEERSAEVPVWLSEGLAQQLIASNEIEIILPPPRPVGNGVSMIATNVSARRIGPVEKAYARLKSNPPLSFYEISWPPEQWSSTEAADVYRSSSQLFFNQLTQLKEGRVCLRAMLGCLSGRLNWQLAFLDAFQPHFSRALDVEKWWALQIVHFAARDAAAQTWSFEESRRRLDDALRVSVEIHTGTNELPLHTTVNLQSIIKKADSLQPAQALFARQRELEMIRPRISQEFVTLVEKYRQALDTYLQNTDKAGKKALEREGEAAITQLDELDVLRVMVRQGQKAIATRLP
jgi:hypothetical protein